MEAAADINTFTTIAEESDDDEDESADCYWDRVTQEAYEAMDQFRDAQDELSALQAEEEEIEYLEAFKCRADAAETAAAMSLRTGSTEFEDYIIEERRRRRVVKNLTGGAAADEVVQNLSEGGCCDVDHDKPNRTEQEMIDSCKNTEFARRFELRQEQLIAEQTARAHAAIAGRTSFKTLSDPENANPCGPSGASKDLDFLGHSIRR